MAALATMTKRFTRLYNALLKSSGRWLNMMNNTALVPQATGAGAITARITTAVTLQNITDGTMGTNNTARTEVDLVAFRKQHWIKLYPDAVGQFKEDTSAQEAEVRAFTSASRVLAEGTVIADLVAGTPGQSGTLATGQIDFLCDGTDAKHYAAMRLLDDAIAYVEVNTAGKDDDSQERTFILVPKASYSNILSLRGVSRFRGDFEREGRRWFYRGYPLFSTSVTTNFGGASKAAAFVIHGDAEALVFNELYMPEDEFSLRDDGMQGLVLQCFGFTGVIQGSHYARVLNDAT